MVVAMLQQMAIWRMRIACWTPKARYTHSEYVITYLYYMTSMLTRTRCSGFVIRTLRYIYCYNCIILKRSGTNLCSAQYVVCSVQCAVCSAQCAVCSAQCTVCIARCTVCSARCAVCSAQCTVCIARCAVCSAQCAVRSAQCVVRGVQCAVHSVKCAVRGV
jgi:hypothetical protein